MPVQVFVDDSGGKGQGAYLVLMGLVAEAEAWASFADEWDRQLQASPRIRYFKFSEAGTLSGEFHGLSQDAAREKLYLLKSVIEKHKPSAVFCAVDVRAFSELFHPLLAVLRGPRLNPLNQPYLWAALNLFRAIHQYLKDSTSGRIEIIFDEQDLFKVEAKRIYEQYRAEESAAYKELMPLEPWFKDDKDFLPLQAADFAAGVLRRGLHEEVHWRHLFCGMKLELNISKCSVIFTRDRLLFARTEIEHLLLRKIDEPKVSDKAES